MKKTTNFTLTIIAALSFFVTANAQEWKTNGTHIHTTNTGNVGIGTTDPKAKLHIPEGGEMIIGNNRSYPALNSSLSITSKDEAATTYPLYVGQPDGQDIFWVRGNTDGFFAGKLGIGIDKPEADLDVKGTIQARKIDLIDSKYGHNSDRTSLYREDVGSDNTTVKLQLGDDPQGSFHVGHTYWKDNKWYSALSVQGNGNIGVGTDITQAKLTVAGDMWAREVRVRTDAGADFVFEKDYDLPSLEEVESFIKENKHLPEIASEAEMIKNDVNIGTFQIQLLQKIEELTLYMIELKKENKNLQERIKTLEYKH